LRFWTADECERWLVALARSRPARSREAAVPFPTTASRTIYSAGWIAAAVAYRRPVLLWVTESHIWDSNWHLYYRFRQSYHDFRLMDEAPGHYFLGHESEDLGSFVQLVMQNGWDAYLLTEMDYVNLFFSHDGFTDVLSGGPDVVAEFRNNAGDAPRAAE
jgi:hypothetical protein